MADRIFRSEQGRARLEGWYDRFLARVPAPAESREVPTAHGPSHVLLAGDEANPPLVCLHGALASSAHILSELGQLSDRHRLIAPDLPGHSARGPQARLPLKDDTLARWLLEVLDGLGVGEFDLLGVSWGGFIARQAASLAPDRVRKLALLVPAGIVSGPAWEGITRMGIPLALYRMFPSEKRLQRFLGGLLTTQDDDWIPYLGDAFRDFALDMRVPPLASDEQLRGLTMPTLLIAAEDDLSFPGEKLIRRAKSLIPRLETELIAGSKHCPPTTDDFRLWLADRIAAFLGSNGHTANDRREDAEPLRA